MAISLSAFPASVQVVSRRVVGGCTRFMSQIKVRSGLLH